MFKKIFITALLCLITQTANAQIVWETTPERAVAVYNKTSRVGTWIYQTIPIKSDAQYSYSVINVMFAYCSSGGTGRHVNYQSQCYALWQNSAGNYGVTTYISNYMGIANYQVFEPDTSRGQSNKHIYSFADVQAWYDGYNTLITQLPKTDAEGDAFFYESGYYPWTFGPVYLRDFTIDTDKGGVSDWVEIYRDPPTSVSNANDDAACWCGACCSCECICTGYQAVICGGGETDCDCHRPQCTCGACCYCKCYCGGYWANGCGGEVSDCSCHRPLCSCEACCECKCTCFGLWTEPCDGTPSGCGCHIIACTCDACCSCKCVCGGTWLSPCNGTGTGCSCHVVCSCESCCSCRCICGGYWGVTCNGTTTQCSCHSVCTCGACCSCLCSCGNWPVIIDRCGGTKSDCSCHFCDCGACCFCKCTCGNWTGSACDGKDQDSPNGCSCHRQIDDGTGGDDDDNNGDEEDPEPLASNDWFPTNDLQASCDELAAIFNRKFGLDLPLLFENVRASSFPIYKFDVPTFTGSPPYTVIIDVESMLDRFRDIVSLFRLLMLGALSYAFYTTLMRLLFKF